MKLWVGLIIVAIIFGFLWGYFGDRLKGTIDPAIKEANPYIDAIVFEDINLRSTASSIVSGCYSGNKECQVSKIYRYVIDNYDYYSDPRSRELIQSPYETMEVKGGDCEDLTILLNSLLENLGIKTYLVLTENHAYSLACGINVDNLWGYIQKDIIQVVGSDLGKESTYIVETKEGKLSLVKIEYQTIALDPGYVWYYGGDGSTFSDPIQYMDIEYSISSSEPLDIYFVPSNTEHLKIANMQDFTHYPSCKKESIYKASGSCDSIGQKGGIVLVNTDHQKRATVSVDLRFRYYYSLYNVLSDEKISYYAIGEDSCVVLDATAGKYGYPGYDADLAGEKIAIDPITKEYTYLK